MGLVSEHDIKHKYNKELTLVRVHRNKVLTDIQKIS